MPTTSTPEARALFAVFVVVLASAALHTVAQAFDRVEATDAKVRYAVDAAQEIKEKVDELESKLEELENQLEELRNQVDERR